eukprot:TRINITY_DN12856_c0_g1_i1.p1 TRINITY_DN12856_c0_g1~~TRINITY_DN12856_c0_g1_i1.p1  ORF type:complete len:580 (+),score=145.66 TRINITY_DN12856_c0_g1_i1:52-1791(+)
MLRAGAVGLLLSAAAAQRSVHVAAGCSDCTSAIQSALSQCGANSSVSDPCTVQLGPGDFILRGPDSKRRLTLAGAQGVRLLGSGTASTRLHVDGRSALLSVSGCEGVTVSGFTVNTTRMPYTLGRAVEVGANGSTLFTYDPAMYPPPDGSPTWRFLHQAQAIMEFDVSAGRPAFGGTEVYALDNSISATWGAAGHLWVSHKFAAGKWYVVRHQVYAYDAFSTYQSRDVEYTDVEVLSTPGMGFYFQFNTNVALRGCSVRKDDGRPMSSTADGSHFNDNRGGHVIIDSCFFEGMGDDGTNIHSEYQDIEAVSADRATVSVGFDGQLQSAGKYAPGDVVEFVGRADLAVQGRAVVKTAGQTSVTFTSAIPAATSKWDMLLDTNLTIEWGLVRNTTVRDNRARGLLLKQNNILAEGNTLAFNTGPGILAAPGGCYFPEGMPFHNWTVRGCSFNCVNYAAAAGQGDVFVMACAAKFKDGQPVKGAGTVINDRAVFGPGITITGNTFYQDAGEAAVYLSGTSGATVQGNAVHVSVATRKQPAATFALDGESHGAVGNNTCFIGYGPASPAGSPAPCNNSVRPFS